MYQQKMKNRLTVLCVILVSFLIFLMIINNPLFYNKGKNKEELVDSYIAKDVTLVVDLGSSKYKKNESYLDENFKYVKVIDENEKEHKLDKSLFPSSYVSSYPEKGGIFEGDTVKLNKITREGDLTAKIHFPLLNKKVYNNGEKEETEILNHKPIKDEVYTPIKIDVYYLNKEGKKELLKFYLDNGVIEGRD